LIVANTSLDSPVRLRWSSTERVRAFERKLMRGPPPGLMARLPTARCAYSCGTTVLRDCLPPRRGTCRRCASHSHTYSASRQGCWTYSWNDSVPGVFFWHIIDSQRWFCTIQSRADNYHSWLL